MNKVFRKTAAVLMSVAMAFSALPSSFAAVSTESDTSYSIQQKSAARLGSASGGTYAAVLRNDKVGNDAQTTTTAGYSQQVETKLSEASGNVSATYFEQDKYISDPTGEKNGQSTYNVTIENAYVGPNIQQPAPEGQDIIIIEDASASMNDRVQYENAGVSAFLQKVYEVNTKRIANAKSGMYSDCDADNMSDAQIVAWMKNNGKLLRILGVESFNYTTYTKWKQDGGSYVLSQSEASAIASASALKNGYPGGEDLKDLTGTDKALQNVRSWISNPSKTSVLLLTDGEPYGDWSNDDLSCGNTDLIMFNSTTANNAINIAKEMKSQGVTIYTSYMFYESNWDNANFRAALSAQDISLITMPPYHNISAVTLSLISSDYPGGGHLGTVSGGTGLDWTFTVDKTNANGFGTHMKLMQNERSIADTIATVAGQIDAYAEALTNGNARYASTSSYILDDISHPFELNGDINSIKVYRVARVPKNLDATGHPADATNVTAFTWGEKEDITDLVSVSLDDHRIIVTGFNYEYNALTTFDHDMLLDDKDKPADWTKYEAGDYGYKLVVEFPIYANRSFGGNDIETNDSTTSGFYPSTPGSKAIQTFPKWTSNSSLNPNGSKYIALYPVPMVDLKVNYKIVGSDQIIYAPQTAGLLNLVSESSSVYTCTIFNVGDTKEERDAYFSAKGAYETALKNYTEQKASYDKTYKENANSSDPWKIASLADQYRILQEMFSDMQEKKEKYYSYYAYIPDGDNNAYVDITYTLTSPSGKIVGTMNIPHGTSLDGEADNSGNIKWMFTDGDNATITESGTYKISATVLPVKTTRAESYTGSSAADATCSAKDYTKSQTSRIYQLQITMKDTAKKPGQSLDFADDANEIVFNAASDTGWQEVHWVSAKWVCIDGSTPSEATNEPGKASLQVGEEPLGAVKLGDTSNVSETDGTKHVSKTAADNAVIPVRVSITRKVGNLNKNVTTDVQNALTVANMSDDDHLYGAYSSVVWKHECDVADDCNNKELVTARKNIDGGKTTGQNITRFLIHISDTILPEVDKSTSTPTIDVGGDIQWKVTVRNDNTKENKYHKTTRAQMLDVLPYQNDGRENPNNNKEGGSSFGSELYFKTISVDCSSATAMVSAYQNGSAKLYYTTDKAVRTASREQWYSGSIQWTQANPSVNGNTVSFSVPQNAVAIKSDTTLAWNEKMVFNLTANVKDKGQQKTRDVYINQAFVGNDDSTKASDPVVTELIPVAITGTIWYDDNANGQMDSNEKRAEGVTVSLYRDWSNESTEHISLGDRNLEKCYNAKEELVSSYMTGSNGYFEFNNLPAGKYYIVATNIDSDYKVTKKQKSGTDNALNSKAEESMPAGQTAWIKEIWVGSSSVPYQNIGLVVQKGTVTITKVMENGKLYSTASMTDEQKSAITKNFVFNLKNNNTGAEYSASVVVNRDNTDGVSATFKDLPLGTYTLTETTSLGYELVSMEVTKGNVQYSKSQKNATVYISAGDTDIEVTVNNRTTETDPGVYPGSGVINHVGTALPIAFEVTYTHGDINDQNAVSYTFKQSDFSNMKVTYDDGTYRDFTGTYKINADGTTSRVGDNPLRFDEVSLSPATVTNERNTTDSGNELLVSAYFTERNITLSSKFGVHVNLRPMHKFTVIFHANGTKFAGSTDTNTVRFAYNDITEKNDIISGVYRNPDAFAGCTFAGWNTASDGSGVNYDSLTALNEIGANQRNVTRIDLYAHWTTTITFHANGGTLAGGTTAAEQAMNGQAYGSMTVNVGSKAATNLYGVMAKKEHLLWNTASNGSGKSITQYGTITGPVTFYAIYMQSLYEYVGYGETFVAPVSGQYKIECWGSGGGTMLTQSNLNEADCDFGGHGAYTSGTIHLNAGETLYVYVGSVSGYNGGGGRGGTDVRLVGGNWDNFDSLKSRIMVAGAGSMGVAGDDKVNRYFELRGLPAGGLTTGSGTQTSTTGYNVGYPNVSGAGQTYGGVGYYMDDFYSRTGTKVSQGGFGYGGYGHSHQHGGAPMICQSGSGSGYYGGASGSSDCVWYTPTAGTSYISGYSGCNSVAESSTADNIIHTGSANHYSGKVFSNPIMIPGDGTQPTVNGGTQNGNRYDGVAKFSIVSRD